MADLRAYAPRLLLEWEERFGAARHQALTGTLVFADVSGFTKLSEKLERAGRVGAEQMAETINFLFGELLMLAAVRGGEMLKYGGDAMLLFFTGKDHAARAMAGCVDMQTRLRQIGRIDTGAGVVRLRMSVGAHSGSFDFFVGGRLHRELVVAGPDTTITVAMEAAADATEILMSPATAALLASRHHGAAKAGGRLLRGHPKAALVEPVPLSSSTDGSRFLDEQLVQHLSSGAAHPEHRLATVAFLQFLELNRLILAGKTADATARVDDVLTLTQEAFNEYGVTFLATDLAADGAKVLAAAGAPAGHEDDEERMLRAARRILDGGPALPVRIGINRGHVFAGDVGPTFRRTYTTMGDVTNTAARVMGQAGAGECLALEPVLNAATTVWMAERLTPFIAKGKTEPLVAWLVGEAGARRMRESTLPLIGRDHELAVLSGALRESVGAVKTVDVVGEPGLGKSRLIEEVVALGRADGRADFSVRCEPFSSTTPYRAVQALVSSLSGPTTGRELAEVGAQSDPALTDETPLIARALGLEVAATSAMGDLDGSVLPQRIAKATAAFVAGLLPRNAIVVIEDSHWVDQASAAVLEELRTAGCDDGLFLAVTRRDSSEGWTPVEPDATVVLGTLGPEAALALIEAASPRPLLPEEARRLADRAGGNPLFVEQLAAAPRDVDLPDSLEELIATRIDQLPAEARDILRRLSVLGPAFAAELLPAVAPEALPASLRPFLSREDDRLAFTHALLQQTAYAGLPFRRRRELHRRVVAQLLQKDAADRPVEELSLHCDAAAMWPETWRYATAAARGAEESYAFGIAARHWERAARAAQLSGSVTPTAIAEAWFACGEACRRAGQVADANAAFRAGRKVAPRGTPQSIGLAAAVGRAFLLEGKLQRAADWGRRARRELEMRSAPFATEALVEELLTEVALARSRFADVLARGRPLVARAVAANSPQVEARVRSLVYLASMNLRLADEQSEGEMARDAAERAGDLRSLVSILSNLGQSAQRNANWERAVACFGEASGYAARAGFALGGAVIDNNVAEILVHQGRLDEALRLFERSRMTAAAAGVWHAAYIAANIGWVLGLQGRFELAAKTLDEAGAALAALGLAGEAERRKVAVAILRGDARAAMEGLDHAPLAAAVDDDVLLLAARSHALRQLGRSYEALACAERARLLALDGDLYAELGAIEALHRLGQQHGERIVELCRALDIVARPAVPRDMLST